MPWSGNPRGKRLALFRACRCHRLLLLRSAEQATEQESLAGTPPRNNMSHPEKFPEGLVEAKKWKGNRGQSALLTQLREKC